MTIFRNNYGAALFGDLEIYRKIGMLALIISGIVYLICYWPIGNEDKVVTVKPLPSDAPKVAEEKKKEEKAYITLRGIEKKNEVKGPPETIRPVEKKGNTSKPAKLRYGYSNRFMAKGRDLIGAQGQKIGSFPEISVNYRVKLGINGYLEQMQGIGGRFFIYDRRKNRLVAELDLKAERLVSLSSLHDLSPRSRSVGSETVLTRYINYAQAKYGSGDYIITLLIPLAVDHQIVGVLNDAAKKMRTEIQDYRKFYGYYTIRQSRLKLHISKGKLKNGKGKRMNITIDLS